MKNLAGELPKKKLLLKLIVQYQILWFSPIPFLNTGLSTKYEASETKSIDFTLMDSCSCN